MSVDNTDVAVQGSGVSFERRRNNSPKERRRERESARRAYARYADEVTSGVRSGLSILSICYSQRVENVYIWVLESALSSSSYVR